MPIEIREAHPEDAPAIQAIYAPVVTGTAISFEEVPPTVEEMRHTRASIGHAPPIDGQWM